MLPSPRSIERDRGVARRIVAEGHELGNHTYSHPREATVESPRRLGWELRRTWNALQMVVGVSPSLLRPPHGWRSPWMMRQARDSGYTVVTGNVSSNDWRRIAPDVVADNVLTRARPGSIVLLHDGIELLQDPAMQHTARALPAIISGLRAKDLAFVTISELARLRGVPPVIIEPTTEPGPARANSWRDSGVQLAETYPSSQL